MRYEKTWNQTKERPADIARLEYREMSNDIRYSASVDAIPRAWPTEEGMSYDYVAIYIYAAEDDTGRTWYRWVEVDDDDGSTEGPGVPTTDISEAIRQAHAHAQSGYTDADVIDAMGCE